MKKTDILIFGFFLLFLPLFFYNLGAYSLADFDEAWYGDVARNILISRNPLILSFNGGHYIEHPPLGFILMDSSFLLFGFNEFGARFWSAFLAFGSIIILYLIGQKLFNRYVGISASLVLLSCVWFVFRARTGNLDTVFLFFYLLTFYMCLKLKDNFKFIYLTAFSFSFLMLTKMLVGITVLVPIIAYVYIEKIVIEKKKLLKAVIIFCALTLPWLLANYINQGSFFLNHMILVGFRPTGRIMIDFRHISSSITFQYLHFGMRKWYYPALISILGSLIFIRRVKQLIPIYLIILVFLYGFLTNTKTEIWHLIPLYPFLGLFISFFFYHAGYLFYKKMFKNTKLAKRLTAVSLVIVFFISALWQIYKFRNEIHLWDNDISGLAYTASKSKGYKEQLYLYADYFLPSAVFYSGKHVNLVANELYPKNTLVGIINSGPKPFLLLGEKWKFDLDKIDPSKYTLISDYKEYRLIRVN